MGRIKVFVYLFVFLIAGKVKSQTIDTIAVKINFPYGYQEAHCIAQKVIGTDTSNFVLNDTVNYSFKWSGVNAPQLDSLPEAVFYYNVDGNYNVELTVSEKATSTTFNFVQPVSILSPPQVRVPNVFTPNNDRDNDLFKVFYDGITVIDFTIYSRTGTKVFGESAPSIVWDGRNSSGSELSQGVYYYVLKLEGTTITQNGFIHLYR